VTFVGTLAGAPVPLMSAAPSLTGGTNTLTVSFLSSAVNAWTGPINLNASSTVQVDAGMLTVSGQVSGTADLTKQGGGTLVLAGASTYTGQTNVNQGIVQLGSLFGFSNIAGTSATAFGAITGSIVVAPLATLQLNPSAGTTYVGKQLILN